MGRLVELELENFKSYQGRQTIGPFYNFTSVIGPNGSGKSNLMDAISFVLGVKSAQLRSSQLKELIYKGGRGKARSDGDADGADENEEGDETVAQPTRAYVTAVYETAEKVRVRFTRTITRAGVSEYKIDGKTVTFAKYSATLEDENILIKAKNFLVFQGDVEAVASQSSKDLTRLVEQISGSLDLKPEYERLKELQEQATENSAHTFNKKRGINAEMKQFKEQKEEAQRFDKLQKQKAKQIQNYLIWKLYHIEEKVTSLQEAIEHAKQSSEEHEEEMTNLENKLKEAKRQQAKANKELLRAEKKIADKQKRLDEQKPELLRMEQKIVHGKRKLKIAQDNAKKASTELEKEEASIKDLEKDQRKLRDALRKFEEGLQARQAERGNQQLDDAALAEYQSKKGEVTKRTFAEKQELLNLQRQRKTEEETQLRLTESHTAFQTRKETLEEEQNAMNERKVRLEEQVGQLDQELKEARKKITAAESEKRKLILKETELNENLVATQQQLQQARVDRHESEKETRRREMLVELKRVFQGVHGRVMDLCKPTQRKYQLAISIILGRNMDAIVVDTQEIAIECIKYLREQRLGMATFLPLSTISYKAPNELLRNLKGAHLALDVIQFDDAYARAMSYACGNTLVCDTMDIARDICYKQKVQAKAVSLDGTVIHKTGMITGGNSGQDSRNAQRWDERDVDNLKKNHAVLMQQMQELTKEKRRNAHDDVLRSAVADMESRLRSVQDDLAMTVRKIASLEEEIRHLNDEMRQSAPELARTESKIESIDEEIEEKDALIREVENEVFADFCESIGVQNIREYEEGQLQLSRETEDRRMQFETAKAKLDNQLDFERSKLRSTQERIEKLEATIAADEKSLAECEEEKNALEVAAELIKEELVGLNERLDAAKGEVELRLAAVQAAKKEIQKLNKETEARSKVIVAKDLEIEKLHADKFSIYRRCKLEEIDLPLLEGSLADLSLDHTEGAERDEDDMETDQDMGTQNSRARVEGIKVDFSSLKAAYKEDGSDEMDTDFQDLIRNLTNEIEKLAPNMRAIDKLDEVEGKLKDTAIEFDNARKEAKAAKDAFVKIKQERYDRFNAAYTHIAEQIDPIYKELTRSKTFPLGGTAYLSLEDTEEPYNEGIKYHAMPPMKRFRDMELLSGGEKTVAALALLFAIHSFQPAPFFVLDEVDAALDNTNVAKVAAYIRHHASDTFQFIVISLKSTFYEKASALVGIYKDQQAGSSKVLTLDLDRFEG